MKKESIIALPNPHLRQKSTKVHTFDESMQQLIHDMTSASIDWENSRPHEISAALAAVQIDRLERVIIIRSSFEDKSQREFTALINPEIVKYEGEQVEDYEGCLSVKSVYGRIKRWSRVRVRAYNLDGDEVRFKADGFLARVIQHEVDHTNGILFVDHIRDQHDAFYRLDDAGELQPLDYDEHIASSDELWSDE